MAKADRTVKGARAQTGEIIRLLVTNAAAELATYYHYTILQVNLTGLDGKTIRDIIGTAQAEDRNHFELLVPRIYELGGRLPDTIVESHSLGAYPLASPPEATGDIMGMLAVLVEAERRAVRGYINICSLTAGEDRRTYYLCRSILNEEIEHESWLSEFLCEGSYLLPALAP